MITLRVHVVILTTNDIIPISSSTLTQFTSCISILHEKSIHKWEDITSTLRVHVVNLITNDITCIITYSYSVHILHRYTPGEIYTQMGRHYLNLKATCCESSNKWYHPYVIIYSYFTQFTYCVGIHQEKSIHKWDLNLKGTCCESNNCNTRFVTKFVWYTPKQLTSKFCSFEYQHLVCLHFTIICAN